MTNILLLSVGTRNKIVQYFKNAFRGQGYVIATDMSRLAPALYDADRHYIVPSINDPAYIEQIFAICRMENISGVLSLIDPELSILAKNEDKFNELGVTVIGSPYDVCERALDKMEMYLWLKSRGYLCAKSYSNINDFYYDFNNGLIEFPVYVKPIRGSASLSVTMVDDFESLDFYFSKRHGLMIQESLRGQEIGADCYIDLLSGELVSLFLKKKLLMRAGETDKSVSFIDDSLVELIEHFVSDSGWRGQIDIDIFEVGGDYYISEVNPRFGGGYPHAHECGCDHMSMILNNLKGIPNTRKALCYREGIYMMKYLDIILKEIDIEKQTKENV